MALELSKQETTEVAASIRRFFREEWDEELSEMRSRFLLEYFMKEVAPFAYNRGVADAQKHLRVTVEDLASTCFEEGLTYWHQKKRG